MRKSSQTIFYIIFFLVTLFIYQPTLAQTIYIEVDDLLVRSGPGTSYDLIGHVNEGETYPLTDEDGDWFAISYENQIGWVSSEYASKTDQTDRSEEHTSELQSRGHLVCRLLLEKKKHQELHRKHTAASTSMMVCHDQ